jgi:hypothetical protein
MGTTYEVGGAAVQNGSNLITWMAFCAEDGFLQAGQTACTVQLYECDGDNTLTTVSGATETVNTPEATTNTFSGSFTKELTAGSLYFLHIDITVDTTNRYGAVPLAVPVRTS